MTPLKLGVVYRLDLTDKIMFGPIKKQILYERFTDGRISGLLSEDLANSLYNNITKAPSEKSFYDVMDDEGRKYECRTITRKGSSLLPSNQLGQGRRRDLQKHQEKQRSLFAYIFTDIRHSPIFRIVAVPINLLDGKTSITSLQFDRLIKQMREVRI